ncbi:hypothetical protein SAMN04515667_1120 [Formosa sp. Hel1_31_208]|nr:hypothetical protein SAMN04515667_1120 [Formosa sp. Hel1_31_208]
MVCEFLFVTILEIQVISVQKYLNTECIAVKKNIKQYMPSFKTNRPIRIECFPNLPLIALIFPF